MNSKLTLLVEPNPKIGFILSLNLRVYVDLEVAVCPNWESGAEFIKNHPDLKLILAKSTLPNAMNNLIKTPLIALGENQQPANIFVQIPNSLDVKSVIKSSASALGITAKEMVEKVVPEFYPIPLEYFFILKNTNCTLFKKVDDSFTTVALANSTISKNDWEKLKTNGIKEIYVHKLERLKIVNLITSEFMGELEDKDLNAEEQIQAQESNYKLLGEKLTSFGVTEEVITLSKKTIASMQSNASKHPKITTLLARMLKNQSSFLFQHTQVLTYFCIHLMKNVDWGTLEQQEKISFIAFFHDISLTSDEQAKIRNNEELRVSALSQAEKELVEKHANISAELVSKYPQAPIGVDQLIRQHHGVLNGIGFSEHYGANLSPITILFIVAEELTQLVLSTPTNKLDKKQLIKELKERFPSPKFKKIIDLLESLSL